MSKDEIIYCFLGCVAQIQLATIYSGGLYPRTNSSVKLRISNGGPGQSGLIKGMSYNARSNSEAEILYFRAGKLHILKTESSFVRERVDPWWPDILVVERNGVYR